MPTPRHMQLGLPKFQKAQGSAIWLAACGVVPGSLDLAIWDPMARRAAQELRRYYKVNPLALSRQRWKEKVVYPDALAMDHGHGLGRSRSRSRRTLIMNAAA
ncbi:hypothetical protein NA56DRAFT_711316 [Hyaloscypha hepaticicola]|uniref:Uncharacterized protein n=1 Tax=Hyaloscypha hepaticicola TaxID=2082293 RepID=A0A2J6PJT1_9HELO|nr:hypothetical protein NA56DRAFT_711316 [Hyaloscypha hepaticicola]